MTQNSALTTDKLRCQKSERVHNLFADHLIYTILLDPPHAFAWCIPSFHHSAASKMWPLSRCSHCDISFVSSLPWRLSSFNHKAASKMWPLSICCPLWQHLFCFFLSIILQHPRNDLSRDAALCDSISFDSSLPWGLAPFSHRCPLSNAALCDSISICCPFVTTFFLILPYFEDSHLSIIVQQTRCPLSICCPLWQHLEILPLCDSSYVTSLPWRLPSVNNSHKDGASLDVLPFVTASQYAALCDSISFEDSHLSFIVQHPWCDLNHSATGHDDTINFRYRHVDMNITLKNTFHHSVFMWYVYFLMSLPTHVTSFTGGDHNL